MLRGRARRSPLEAYLRRSQPWEDRNGSAPWPPEVVPKETAESHQQRRSLRGVASATWLWREGPTSPAWSGMLHPWQIIDMLKPKIKTYTHHWDEVKFTWGFIRSTLKSHIISPSWPASGQPRIPAASRDDPLPTRSSFWALIFLAVSGMAQVAYFWSLCTSRSLQNHLEERLLQVWVAKFGLGTLDSHLRLCLGFQETSRNSIFYVLTVWDHCSKILTWSYMRNGTACFSESCIAKTEYWYHHDHHESSTFTYRMMCKYWLL